MMLLKKQVPILWAVIITLCILCIALGWTILNGQRTQPLEQEIVQPDRTSGQPPAVARVGNEIISESALKEYLEFRSPAKDTLTLDEKSLLERLQEMISLEVLFQEAKRLGIDREAGYKQTIRKILSQELILEQVVEPELNRIIPPDEIQAYYEKHSNEYARPAQIRLADIFIKVENGISGKEQQVKQLLAEKVLTEALHVQDKQFGFIELIDRYSEKHHGYLVGDTDFFGATGRLADVDPEFVSKAFTFGGSAKKGAVVDKLIETPFGFHIVMPVGRRSAFHRDLSEVTPEIERRIHQGMIAANKKDYVQRLNRGADVAVDQDRIKELSRTVYR